MFKKEKQLLEIEELQKMSRFCKRIVKTWVCFLWNLWVHRGFRLLSAAEESIVVLKCDDCAKGQLANQQPFLGILLEVGYLLTSYRCTIEKIPSQRQA